MMHPWPCSCGLTCTLLKGSLSGVEQTKIFCQAFSPTSFRIFSVLVLSSCNHCTLLSGFFCFQNYKYLSVNIKVDYWPHHNAGILLCMWASSSAARLHRIVWQHCLSPCGCLQTRQGSVWHIIWGKDHGIACDLKQYCPSLRCYGLLAIAVRFSRSCDHLRWSSLCSARHHTPERTLWGDRDGTKQLLSQPGAILTRSQEGAQLNQGQLRGQRK